MRVVQHFTTAIGTYYICFEAEREFTSARHHFIKELGWTPAEYRKIERFEWFSAKVSVQLRGYTLAEEYLGCCSYRSASEFYTEHADDYYADMVGAATDAVKDDELHALVEAWKAGLRK